MSDSPQNVFLSGPRASSHRSQVDYNSLSIESDSRLFHWLACKKYHIHIRRVEVIAGVTSSALFGFPNISLQLWLLDDMGEYTNRFEINLHYAVSLFFMEYSWSMVLIKMNPHNSIQGYDLKSINSSWTCGVI